MDDKKAIVCNFAISTKTATKGTRAYYAWGNSGGTIDGGRIYLYYRSRGGRYITKYEALKNLHNFRLTTVPPEHPFYDCNALNKRFAAHEPEWMEEQLKHIRYHLPTTS